MNGEETRFKPGNKAAEKYDAETARQLLEEAFLNAFKDDKILCVQDAFFSIDMRPTTAHYLIKKFPELEDIKKDINDIIISRINKKALAGDYNATASIWRFKQLGEKDEKTVDNKSSDGSMSPFLNLMQQATSEDEE